MNEPSTLNPSVSQQPVESTERQWPRLLFPSVSLAVFWAASFGLRAINKPYFVGFMIGLALSGLLTLLAFGWWWFNRRLYWWEKFAGFGLVILEAVVVSRFADRSITPFALWISGLPVLGTLSVAWLYLVKRFRFSWARIGFVAVVTLGWAYFTILRLDGADGGLNIASHLRWTPTAEQRFLAQSGTQVSSGRKSPMLSEPIPPPGASDWVAFRGQSRDGVIVGSTLATNWVKHPPKLSWQRAVGPAWSSLIVVGSRLFTQEQRGQHEVVACYATDTGDEIWAHQDDARFDESVSGPGPRATPSFDSNRLYTLGGTGLLDCLDAASGHLVWQRNIAHDAGARVPMWAFSSSPLVTGGLIVVYAGGEADKGLLAYRASSGELAWASSAGSSSYSSPELTSLEGVPQCLMLHDSGLSSFDLNSGAKLWQTGSVMKGAPRYGQPRLVGTNQLLVAALGGLGCSLIEVVTNGSGWTTSTIWDSRELKPEFPDFVVYNGYAYGFDIGVFCCLNLADGKRAWKEGRYGRGEVMLLRDQGWLLISSETGELVLLDASPKANHELGRFQALTGKTWNHPVVRGNQVYLRNAQEMARYTISSQ
jgi:outer membrane protein assembly factor BamB